MIGRRELFGAAAATVALGKLLQGDVAKAASTAQATDAMQKLAALEPRGADGRLLRLASLDLESQQDFTLGFRLMYSKQLRAASMSVLDRLLEAEGIDPTTPMTAEQLLSLIEKDPAINISSRSWLANQQITWKTLMDYYHKHADFYLSEMEVADKSGPGSLLLAPDMSIPDYARHEIHVQPGGYVGDPFAGYVYHYGTNSFYISVIGHNEQDQVHKGTAARLPLPEDGKVRRILDMGCGVGQFTAALKERFPDAEVWGVDVGGPMVRYAHMRAARLGIDVNFAQKLAQDTGFPDDYFDLVTSYIAHHEMPADVTREVIAEANRITRSGGVFYPVDFNSGGNTSPAPWMFSRWWDHRWNNEVWSFDYHAMDFSAEIAKRGFMQVKDAKAALPGFGVRHFVRTA